MHPRHVPAQLRRAAVLRPAPTFLWRELIVRRKVTRRYRVRASGQSLVLRHRTPDLGGVTEVLVNGNYRLDPRLLAPLADRRPLRAVDLGANIGLFGLALRALHPDVQLVAVEADASNAAVLRATIAANGAGDCWSVIEAVATTSSGTLPFRSGHFLESRLDPDGEPVTAIDVFPLLAGADVVKIDIEGAERAILDDPRFDQLTAQILFLEYHPPLTRVQVTQRLVCAGFIVERLRERHGHGDLCARRVRGPREGAATSR